MASDALRSITLTRRAAGRFVARNTQGVEIDVGGDGAFSPIELLLAAISGCTALDVDALTSRRAEPDEFDVRVTADKIRDEAAGNRLENIALSFHVTFPAGEQGDAARERLPSALARSHDWLCTVSRTVELGTPVEVRLD